MNDASEPNREYMFGANCEPKNGVEPCATKIKQFGMKFHFIMPETILMNLPSCPNDIHGVIVIVGATPRGCPVSTPPWLPWRWTGTGTRAGTGTSNKNGQAQGPAPTGMLI